MNVTAATLLLVHTADAAAHSCLRAWHGDARVCDVDTLTAAHALAVAQRLVALLFCKHCFALVFVCDGVIAAAHHEIRMGEPVQGQQQS